MTTTAAAPAAPFTADTTCYAAYPLVTGLRCAWCHLGVQCASSPESGLYCTCLDEGQESAPEEDDHLGVLMTCCMRRYSTVAETAGHYPDTCPGAESLRAPKVESGVSRRVQRTLKLVAQYQAGLLTVEDLDRELLLVHLEG